MLVPVLIDTAKPNEAGVLVGRHSNETIEQVAKRYPGAQIGELVDIISEKEAMLKTLPVEITEARYFEMLEVLPPEDWKSSSDGSSFKLCEYLSGLITSIYVAMGPRYFAFNDLATLPHAAIMQKVKDSLEVAA